MNSPNLPSELVCFHCGAAFSDQSECPDHPGFPLLDPTEPGVVDELKKREAKLREIFVYKLAGYGFIAGLVPGVFILVVLYGAMEAAGFDKRHFEFLIVCVFGLIGAGIGWKLGPGRFNSPYARWTGG